MKVAYSTRTIRGVTKPTSVVLEKLALLKGSKKFQVPWNYIEQILQLQWKFFKAQEKSVIWQPSWKKLSR